MSDPTVMTQPSGGGSLGAGWLGGGEDGGALPPLGGGDVAGCGAAVDAGAAPSRRSPSRRSYSTGMRLGCSRRSASDAQPNDCSTLPAACPSIIAFLTMYSTRYERPKDELS